MSDRDALTPRVYIVRHGETEWAKQGRFTGTTEVDLTEEGAAQVSSVAATLVGPGRLLDPQRLACIYVSPRKRAQNTCELLLAPYSGTGEINKTVTDAIREWDYGDYEGLTDQEIRLLRKRRGLDMEREWDIWSDGCEGGESSQQITDRLDRIITQIREVQEHCMRGEQPADVLLVAHGLINRCFWKRWSGYPIEEPFQMLHSPGEIAILSYKHSNINKPGFHIGVSLPPKQEITSDRQ